MALPVKETSNPNPIRACAMTCALVAANAHVSADYVARDLDAGANISTESCASAIDANGTMTGWATSGVRLGFPAYRAQLLALVRPSSSGGPGSP